MLFSIDHDEFELALCNIVDNCIRYASSSITVNIKKRFEPSCSIKGTGFGFLM